MKKNASYILVGLTLAACLATACSDNKQKKDKRTDTYSSGVISITSDESFKPIVEEEREVFESIYTEAKIKPIYTNESEGITNLLQAKGTWLVITARNFKPDELQGLKDRNFLPKSMPLAYDGLALIVNKSNTDTCISVSDIKKILNGEANKWSDLYPGSKRGDITLVFDNPKSSAVHFVEDSILGGNAIKSQNVVAAQTSAEVIKYVEKTEGAIGIIGSNWLNDKRDSTNLTFNSNIRLMSVSKWDKANPKNSWKPYQYYIYNGNYPLVRTIYALLNDPINGLPWGFASFIASPKGQLIILKAGLLPVYGNITIRDVNVSE